MTERFIESDSTLNEVLAGGLLGEVASIDEQRRDVGRKVDDIGSTSIERELTLIRHEFGPDGAVQGTIVMLERGTVIVERQLAVLASLQARIDEKRKEPLRIRDLAMDIIAEIDELRTELTQQIQNLQAQKNTTANRAKINDLEREKIYTHAARYADALDARTLANADLRRLNDPASIVAYEKNARLNILAEYQTEVQTLKSRIDEVAAVLGRQASVMAEVKVIAGDPYVSSDIPLPERLPDIRIDDISRPALNEDSLSFTQKPDDISDRQSVDSPANVSDFSDNVVSIDAAYIHTVPKEAKQPDSLHPLISEAVLQARKSQSAPKKGKRIRGFLRIN